MVRYSRFTYCIIIIIISFGCSANGTNIYYNKANAYLDASDYKNAKANYNKCIDINPNEPNYWYGRGLTNYYLGELSAAEVDFNSALMIKGDYADAYISLGMIYLEEDKYRAAINAFDKGIDADPVNETGYLNRAKGKYLTFDVKGALKDYLKVVELNKNSSIALNNIATIYNYLGDWESAIKYAELAMENGDSSPQIYGNLGYGLIKTKEYKRAGAILESGLDKHPGYAVYYKHRGELKRANGDEDGALADFRKALELNPDYPSELLNRARGRIKIGFYDGAIEDLDLIIFYNPDLTEAYQLRGEARLGKGEEQGAEEDYTKADEMNSGKKKEA